MSALLLMWLTALAPVSLAGPGTLDGIGDRGPPPRFEGRDRPDGNPELSPRLIEELTRKEGEILAMLEATDPQRHERLLRLRETDHQAYLGHLFRIARRVGRGQDDPASRERFEKIAAAEVALGDLTRGYRELSDGEKAERRAEMERLAGELFELKQEERRMRLQDLRTRIDELQREIDDRESNRASVVRAFVDQLVHERVDL
jgi:hypothetical protein